ncbi:MULTISPECIES: sensor histidine kinase [Streptomyces]|uniref:sensor histidine kinase n=1 Tax=Streptomyces TaxID=1883 RepID=UPI0004CD537F|nr:MULTISPECIES: histidine kinase [Streptomyces]
MTNPGRPGLARTERGWPWWAEALLLAAVAQEAGQEAYISAGGTVLSPEVALAVAGALSVALRYRHPAVALVCTVALAAGLGMVLPLLVVLFHLVAHGRLVVPFVAAAAALAGNALVQPPQSLWMSRSYGPLMPLGIVLALGLWASSRRRLEAALAARVEQLRVERELRAEQARLTERARIAAEMHDVLAHRLTVLALHTGALQRRADTLPAPVADRLALLRTTSTEALGDLRDVLGALRDTEGQPEQAAAGASRLPGLRELSALLDEARAAGQKIEADIEGDGRGLPAGRRLAVHRLVQEALTNARKHAPGAPVRVTVRYGPHETAVEVRNAPAPTGAEPPAALPASGYGLLGLTERMSALGGTLEYGPTRDGGRRIAATLPTHSGPDAPTTGAT